MRFGRLAGVVVVGALALTACGTDENSTGASGSGSGSTAADISCASGTINAAGSSAQANAVDAWKKSFQQACKDATVNYQASGSGAGIESFINGQVAFAGSDSALKDTEQPKADARCKTGKALNLPMVTGPIAVAYNLPGVDKLQLKPETIAGIFSGTIKTWDDPKIKADNPGATLPSTPIQAFHRSDSSGTTDNFTKFLKAAAGPAWTFDSGKEWKAPGGQGAKGSQGLAGAVKGGQGAVAYMELSFAENSGLQIAKVANKSGEFVELTPEAAGKAVEAAKIVGTGNDLKLKIDYATSAAGAYPLVLVTYEIVCEKGLAADQAKLTKAFLSYTSSDDGQKQLGDLGYAPLPKSLQDKVKKSVGALAAA